MATHNLQVSRWLMKFAAEVLLSMFDLSDVAEKHAEPTLQGLPAELIAMIAMIASHLDSASLCNLHDTSNRLCDATDFHYMQEHPTRTICHSPQQLPGFLDQLARPDISHHITHVTLRMHTSPICRNTPYPPAGEMFDLPFLKTLVLKNIAIDGISLYETCRRHYGSLKKLVIHDVAVVNLEHWEILFFYIGTLMRLHTFLAQDLIYREKTGGTSLVRLETAYVINGLDGERGFFEIRDTISFYFNRYRGRRFDVQEERMINQYIKDHESDDSDVVQKSPRREFGFGLMQGTPHDAT